MGTPAYMSPEARRGDTPDERFDLWSLCVVFHEAFTGQRQSATSAVAPLELESYFSWAFDESRSRRPASARALVDRLRELRQRIAGTAEPFPENSLA